MRPSQAVPASGMKKQNQTCSSKQTLYKIAVFKVGSANTSYTACSETGEYKTKPMRSHR